MSIRDLVPWRRGNGGSALARRESDPFLDLRREMNRIFDRFGLMSDWDPFFGGAPLPAPAFGPAVDVSETDNEVRITAELPGLERDDVEVSLDQDAVVLSGEKKEESERRESEVYRAERYYGAFNRRIPLPCDVNFDKAEATFRKGVLRITLPKTEEAKRRQKRIEIKSG